MVGVYTNKQKWRRQPVRRNQRADVLSNQVYQPRRTMSETSISSDAPLSSSRAWATTGDLRYSASRGLHAPQSQEKRQVVFSSAVRVVLIPTVDEYQEANLTQDIWWEDKEYKQFKLAAVQELKDYLRKNPGLDAKKAVQILYQATTAENTTEEEQSDTATTDKLSEKIVASSKLRGSLTSEEEEEEEAAQPSDESKSSVSTVEKSAVAPICRSLSSSGINSSCSNNSSSSNSIQHAITVAAVVGATSSADPSLEVKTKGLVKSHSFDGRTSSFSEHERYFHKQHSATTSGGALSSIEQLLLVRTRGSVHISCSDSGSDDSGQRGSTGSSSGDVRLPGLSGSKTDLDLVHDKSNAEQITMLLNSFLLQAGKNKQNNIRTAGEKVHPLALICS